jgi:hypothetical protein
MSVPKFLHNLPRGLALVASPDVWNEEKKQLCHAFCSILQQERGDGTAKAAHLDFSWNGENWSDATWLNRRLPGFRRQIEESKARGVIAFTICRPTSLFPENCAYALHKLRALAIDSDVSIVIVTHAKKRTVASQAKLNPFNAIRYGKRIESIFDAGGVLTVVAPDTYSLIFKGTDGLIRIFDNIVLFSSEGDISALARAPAAQTVNPFPIQQLRLDLRTQRHKLKDRAVPRF